MNKLRDLFYPYWATFFMTCIASGFMGFIPILPTSVKLLLFLTALTVYCIKGCKPSFVSLFFILYLFINLLITQPDIVFHTEERLSLFVILFLVTYVVRGTYPALFRLQALKVLLYISVVFSVLSFFAFFFGINMMVIDGVLLENYLDSPGWFSGLYKHSIVLGILSGLSTCYLFCLMLQKRNYMYMVLIIPCLGSVLFAASRTAFVALLISLVFLTYKIIENKKKLVKYFIIAASVLVATYPLWGGTLDRMATKQGQFKEQGQFGTRTDKWGGRISEFESNPVFGVGFSVVSFDSGDVDVSTGVIEPGSSWLAIVSMTGILGAIFVFYFFVRSFVISSKSSDVNAVLLFSLLLFMSIDMVSEGYIFAAGSPLCFLLWLICGCCEDLVKNYL